MGRASACSKKRSLLLFGFLFGWLFLAILLLALIDVTLEVLGAQRQDHLIVDRVNLRHVHQQVKLMILIQNLNLNLVCKKNYVNINGILP